MNLTRMGHYHSPYGRSGADPEAGVCSAALVTFVWSDAMVNLVVFDQYGRTTRRSVNVGPPTNDAPSFHPSGDCPWKR